MDINEIEEAILSAAQTLRTRRGAGTELGMASWWPEIGVGDGRGNDIVDPRSRVWVGDIDMMDVVLYLWLGPRSILSVRDKSVVWARCGAGRLTSWRKVGKTCNLSHEFARQIYTAALLTLCNWLNRLDVLRARE